MSHNISIEEYSAKSFVVRGETQPHKESLKSMGGKWNSSLTDRDNGEKFGAWLFWSDKRVEVNNWFKKDCQTVESVGSSKFVGASIHQTTDIIRLENLEKKIDHLIEMMQIFLSNKNIALEKQTETKIRVIADQVVSEDIEVDDSDEKMMFKPVKRLLGRDKNK